MHIFSVRTLTQAVKDVLEGEFPFVWVRGQVSNLSKPPSGHCYFSLKDDDATLSVVWFKGAQPRVEEGERVNPLTGEVETGPVFQLADGQEVLVAGRMNVYPPRGVYQLVAELVQGQGLGELAVAFEAMKSKLAAKGYFDPDRKLRLPVNPRRVAVITAPQGAALQDFLRIAGDRGLGATIRLYPSLVQGEGAPAQIAAALDRADRDDWAEVIVLIRGGGSLEDLWAFNTEPVAEAIYRARLPVLCGVGHEVDTTIADFVADLRAATPSHAAQLLWTERAVLGQQVDEQFVALTRGMERFLTGRESGLSRLTQALSWHSPARRLDRHGFEVERLTVRLRRATANLLEVRKDAFLLRTENLRHAFGPVRMIALRTDIDRAGGALIQAMTRFIYARQSEVRDVDGRLMALDPHAPLARGYALVQGASGAFVRSRADVHAGDALRIHVRDGEFSAEVTE
ncbi:MAG: exodeoxyribonuclease VII large subunit [Deltaproteobacteria bacterium]|nr:exodeoxyribonuclease VII large subunit [Deltaproteobacteria bacterium]